jgi:hypothetical protein
MVTSAAWGSDRFIRTVLVKPANELAECRKLRDAGKGPIETRNSERAEQKAPAATLTATAIFMDPSRAVSLGKPWQPYIRSRSRRT